MGELQWSRYGRDTEISIAKRHLSNTRLGSELERFLALKGVASARLARVSAISLVASQHIAMGGGDKTGDSRTVRGL